MIFLNSLSEKFIGKSFAIDCLDIEIHNSSDHQPPILKGPGTIKGDRTGRLTYKIYNQIQINSDIFAYLKQVQKNENSPLRLFAKSYDGIEWTGSWTVPELNIFQTPHLLVNGEFDQLSTRISKIKGDDTVNMTELVYSGVLDLPLTGQVQEKRFHREKLISTSFYNDHHELI